MASVSSSNIEVAVRIRPPPDDNSGSILTSDSKQSLVMLESPKTTWQVDHIFGPFATQNDVFSIVRPLVHSYIDGFNATIFAYGQTNRYFGVIYSVSCDCPGSGKTHTMLGPAGGRGIALDGVIPRVSRMIFARIRAIEVRFSAFVLSFRHNSG